MDMASAYIPPAPTITSATANLLGVPVASWPNVVTKITGTRNDSAGSFAGDPAFLVPGYLSKWPSATMRGKWDRGEYYTSGGFQWMDMTDHVVDRTTGHLKSYTVAVKLTPYP